MCPKVAPEYKGQRRNEILDVAEGIFGEQGYAATSMADISNECSLSRGGIYQYFGNKEELFSALLERRDEQFNQRMRNLRIEADTVWQAIETYLTSNVDSKKRQRFNVAVYEYNVAVAIDGDKKMSERSKRYNRMLDVFTELLQAGVDDGEFQPVLPLITIADAVHTLFDGIAFTEMGVKPDVVSVAEQIEVIREFLRYTLQVSKNTD
jgi:AcrR family transcriptional regulator